VQSELEYIIGKIDSKTFDKNNNKFTIIDKITNITRMGIRNSSLTRVKPLFDFINSDIEKLNRFLGLFDYKHRIEHNSSIEIGYGHYEKKLPPSKLLLIWMLQNIKDLNKVDNYGVDPIKSKKTYDRRKRLFAGDTILIDEAIKIIETSPKLPEKDWYIFEGYTLPDIYIETTDSIFVGEAKRTEKDITTNTTWFRHRDQLIRHIDSLLDQPKKIYSFYILEKEEYLNGIYEKRMKLYSTKDYFNKNLNHRDNSKIERAFNSFIGFVFWEDIADCFNINFPDNVNNLD